MRDITLEDTFRHHFTTRQFSDGVPTTLSGIPVLSVLEENNATPITAGVSVSVDRASVAGLNEATIVATAANGYETGKTYAIYISTGTVGGVSVVGEVIGEFTIEKSAAFIRLGAPAGASVSADIADVPTVSEFNARTLAAPSYFDPAADTVANVTTTANLTTNNDKTGYQLSATGVDDIWDETLAGHITADTTGLLLNDWQDAGRLDAILDTIAADVVNIDGIVPSAAGDAMTLTAAAIDLIWDEVLTGATHNVASSAGRRLRQLETGLVLDSGTLDAATSNTADLETGVASTVDDFYNHNLLVITGLTGAGQVRVIVDYTGTGNIALVSPPWVTTPDATSTYDVIIGYAHAETTSKTAHVGLAQAGATGSITLASDASAMTDFYKNDVVSIDSGTGEGQERIITAYNGTSKVATVEPDWSINPDSTSNYVVEEALSVADVFAMHHSQPAADNLKDDYDGTGFTRANSTIGTVTTNTDMRGTDSAALATVCTEARLSELDEATGGKMANQVDIIQIDTTTDIPALIAALNDLAASDILTTALTESYAADGVAPTVSQALFRIQQHLGEFGIVGTTLTVRKIDGLATAMTFTLDDATNPTDTTRAT